MNHLPAVSPLLFVVLGAVCISFSAVFAKLSSTSADVSAFYRVFIGGICLTVIAMRFGRSSFLKVLQNHFRLICGGGLCLTLDLMCWHRSINILGPGVATILINFQVFILALAGWIFFKERLSLRFGLAIPLALSGLCLLIGISPANLLHSDLTGAGLGLSAAFWLALYTLAIRYIQMRSAGISAVTVVALVTLASAVSMGIFFIWESTSIVIPTLGDAFWLVLYGVVSQALGWLLISKGLPGVTSAQAGLTILIMPALSFIWDMLIFAKPAGIIELGGALLALLAIWLGTSAKQSEG
ncbi:DMT family transporter [Desulfovibrio sp. JC010]|uniref:DMT family transporter n=1 Tax=Desulfovibrio sp. JC010 TaxID=2593641 RepID=UPI0013D35E20|nr:DMT family transporter [Desulfovibrio sp. JC010]